MIRTTNANAIIAPGRSFAHAMPYVFTNGSFLPSAYDNTLTGLIPDLYAGFDIISRELTGYLLAVTPNFEASRGAVGQAVKGHIAPPAVGTDITPAMTIPEPPDTDVGNDQIVITKSRAYPFGFVGEEQRGLNTGPGYGNVQADMFAQSVRGIVNEMEGDLADIAYLGASRAWGTPGTTPFTTGVGGSAQLAKILDDNGAPETGRQLVINTTTGAEIGTNTQLTKVNEAGTNDLLRQNVMGELHGFMFRKTGQSRTHTAGTAAGATTDGSAYAAGATVITLASAGTGAILAGDVITFAGHDDIYVVASGDADVSGGGTITLQSPGLREALPASAVAITRLASYAANVGFTRDAMILAARLPELPQEGDMAADRQTIVDPRSGMPLEVAIYVGYRKVRYEVAAAWGVKSWKPAHTALLLG